jgi:hypothetical protein
MMTIRRPEILTSTARFGFRLWNWINNDLIGLFRELRWSYLPPLMVYFAAGVSGFTGIIESFFVKEQLGLAAAFLASLGFWAGLPWALKMPLGHLVDLFWRWKSMFVYLGAALMSASLLIMVGLTGHTDRMAAIMAVRHFRDAGPRWFRAAGCGGRYHDG